MSILGIFLVIIIHLLCSTLIAKHLFIATFVFEFILFSFLNINNLQNKLPSAKNDVVFILKIFILIFGNYLLMNNPEQNYILHTISLLCFFIYAHQDLFEDFREIHLCNISIQDFLHILCFDDELIKKVKNGTIDDEEIEEKLKQIDEQCNPKK